jgi:hypothetical protein
MHQNSAFMICFGALLCRAAALQRWGNPYNARLMQPLVLSSS